MVSNKNDRVCFISATNLDLSPYVTKYIEAFNCDFDVIVWSRQGFSGNTYGAQESFIFEGDEDGKLSKAFSYLRFSRFVKKQLEKGGYRLVVFLQSQFAVFNNRVLLKKYLGKYVYDVRDYTFERFTLFRKIQNKLITSSALNVVSSRGYLQFLPDAEYYVSHNIQIVPPETKAEARNKTIKEKLVISNIGLIRFHDQNKKMIMEFANDPRYELRFIGTGALELEGFCKENGVNNVVLLGTFSWKDTIKHFLDADIIFNCYGNDTPMLDFALSNKLYMAAQLAKPILVSPGTYMEELADANEIGFTVDFTRTKGENANQLFEYFKGMQWNCFFERCDRLLESVYGDDRKLKVALTAILKK